MDSSKAHLITLWCAVLSKSNRGMAQLLPKDVTFAHFRVLGELTLPYMEGATPMRLARTLIMKPDDVKAAIEALTLRGFVQAGDECLEISNNQSIQINQKSQTSQTSQTSLKTLTPNTRPSDSESHIDGVFLTEKGQKLARELMLDISNYLEGCRVKLTEKDRDLLAAMLSNALSVPGSVYAGRNSITGYDVLTVPSLRITAFEMMRQAISAAIKSRLSMSLTDFRFLLELYPKKRGVHKLLRARDLVRFLGTGRSYVTTASLRLEEAGYIERIPDADDARGILFGLTQRGSMAVQDVGEDIFAVFASLSGEHLLDRRFIHALKLLLEGQELMIAKVGVSNVSN